MLFGDAHQQHTERLNGQRPQGLGRGTLRMLNGSEKSRFEEHLRMPGRPPGNYKLGEGGVQEFIAGVLFATEARVLSQLRPDGPTAFALTAAVPVGQHRAFDRVLADCERRRAGQERIHFAARWCALEVKPVPAIKGIARLDLIMTGRTLRRPVHARIAFELQSYSEHLWAACLTGRVLLMREPTFRRQVAAPPTPHDQSGLEIEGVGGCEVLRAALEKSGIEDDLFQGRYV